MSRFFDGYRYNLNFRNPRFPQINSLTKVLKIIASIILIVGFIASIVISYRLANIPSFMSGLNPYLSGGSASLSQSLPSHLPKPRFHLGTFLIYFIEDFSISFISFLLMWYLAEALTLFAAIELSIYDKTKGGEALTERICPKCSTKNKLDAKFCENCGEKLV
jgi:hypothetical protein